MLKGEQPDEVFIAPMTSVVVYIDEDNVGMWRVCQIENGMQKCSIPQVFSIGPVTEVVCEQLPGLYRFAIAYLKGNGRAYAKQGKFMGDEMWWDDEIEEECVALDQWSHMN